jgi:hypothetical protein
MDQQPWLHLWHSGSTESEAVFLEELQEILMHIKIWKELIEQLLSTLICIEISVELHK